MLKATGFCALVKEGVDWLPDPKDFDAEHRKWCETICEEAKSCGVQKEMSHGIAAKLINVFIKTLMPPDLETLPAGIKAKWYAVHPPVDRKVLQNMKTKVGDPKFWSSLPGRQGPSWREFNAENYQGVIDLIRKDLCKRLKLHPDAPVPLWMNERFWIL